ncbi:MAG: gamma-glutamyltransferase family protein [Betaproteobacteria bacterium]|nr:gamma-glutamyltransferase family protein [Betaproteobacteria bacterium]
MRTAHCVEALTANRLRLSRRFARLGLALLWPVFFTPLVLAQNAASVQPEAASGWTDKPGWHLTQRAVAAAHPLASEAGYRILQAGGSAVDAAIAVQMVLTLVEPQSSGIGGGAFLLHHDGQQLQVFDGRETAPVLAPTDLFMLHGKPLPFNDVVTGGRAVGVPGVLRMLATAHQQHGRLPWAHLFQPAIELADKGFAISPRLHALLKAEPSLLKDPQAAAYFFNPDGSPLPVGHVLTNPGLAKVLRMLAKQGADAFYTGPLAQRIVDKVQLHPNNPGLLTMADMRKYRPYVRDALCFSHTATTPAQAVKVCGVGPPSSGLITMGQMFGMLAARPSSDPEMGSVDWLHQYNEAARLAFADRAMYIADPLFVQGPSGGWESLLSAPYLDQRASLMGAQRMPKAEAGSPDTLKSSYAPMPAQTELGTSHISIIDGLGHAVSMTTTIESGFGARLMVSPGPRGGFLLNNQLTDFSFVPSDAQGLPIANRLQAGKRPRSSMNPVMVFSDKASDTVPAPLLINMGSPGGAMIIHFTSQSLWAMLHNGKNAQQALNAPHSGLINANGALLLEKNRFNAATIEGLKAKGHEVLSTDMPSGLQALQREAQAWSGAADPRREGWVSGD